jgi:hypothetical protein
MRSSAALTTAITVLFLSRAVAADAPAWPTGTCAYRDLHYSEGTTICVAPHFGQRCGKEGVWETLTNEKAFNEACATAQIPTNPAPATPPPPVTCRYHDIQYSNGAVICVAPKLGQACIVQAGDKDGRWSAPEETSACTNAQIPAPTGAPAAAAK